MSVDASSADGKKKKVKVLRKYLLRSSSKACSSNDAVEEAADDDLDINTNSKVSSSVGHEVCIDIVSKAVHCYICDDYVLSDSPWLEGLRSELSEIELRRDAMEISLAKSSSDDEGRLGADYEIIDHPERGSTKMPSNDAKSDDTAKNDSKTGVRPGITGLENLGNTCYMNSVVQMLSHCSGFQSFFRDYLRAAAPLRLAGEGGYTLT